MAKLSKASVMLACLLLLIPSIARSDAGYEFSDPWEPMNRAFWDFNYRFLDKPLYRPVTHAYADVVPFGARDALNNFIRNLEEPSSLINHLLQGKVERASNNLVRFLFNTTFGLGGLIDIMGRSGATREIEEFGDVLGFYGVPEGPYIMIPVFGPSTIRKEVGDVVDNFTSPYSSGSWTFRFVKWGLDGLYKRAAVIDQEPLLDNSLDSYAFVKDAYLQYRFYRFYNGKPPTDTQQDIDDALDDYLDEIER